MKSRFTILTLACLMSACAPSEPSADAQPMDHLIAWCIVPFDSLERSPEERIEMLQRLGFTRYAYDWRMEHLDSMADELRLAEAKGIAVDAVWMWFDERSSGVGNLGDANERVLQAVLESGAETDLWISFHSNFFAGLSDTEALAKGIAMLDYVGQRAGEHDMSVGLYNHGDWFGDPRNQARIIEALPQRDLTIVYNFHHAHEQLDEFEVLVDAMLPHLSVVNINGMRAEGPKVLPVGQGDREADMLKLLRDKGFEGPIGILGHVDDADVEMILHANLEGYFMLGVQ